MKCFGANGRFWAQSCRSLVCHCQLWANLEEQKVRNSRSFLARHILELADLRKLTARIVFRDRRLSPKKSLAAISRFTVLRALPAQAEMA
jgi:hypothetical protein